MDTAKHTQQSHNPTRLHGHIQLLLGPMFAGKTTELLRRIRRYKLAHLNCIVIKYSHDQRFSRTSISTHDSSQMPAFSCTYLAEISDQTGPAQVIGIDEGQFFPDICTFAENMANAGKVVIIAALDGTFQRQPFNRILDLVPIAESVEKLTAICHVCGSTAAYSKRLNDSMEIELIGGPESYIAVCRRCYFSTAPTPTTEYAANTDS